MRRHLAPMHNYTCTTAWTASYSPQTQQTLVGILPLLHMYHSQDGVLLPTNAVNPGWYPAFVT